MKIGELSRASGCSVQTIRFYEKEGLLAQPPRSEGNYRIYKEAALSQLRFIKYCRYLNISLVDIRQLLQLQENPAASCSSVNLLISEQLATVHQRIAELKSLEHELHKMSKACQQSSTIEQCGIMTSLEHNATARLAAKNSG